MKTTGIFRQIITMNQIYAEIQPSFADLLPDELNHLDEYSNLFSLIDYQPIRYNKVTDDPLLEERKEDLNNTIFDKIDKPEYTPPQESAAAADIYDDMLKQDHLLIAGTTGSGKSFIIKRLIEHLKDKNCSIVLFDPKIVELIKYKKLPNVTMYQTEAERIAVDLKCLCYAMDQHFIALSKRELTKTTAEHTYIIIDEFADLVNIPGNKKLSKEIFAYCQKIAQKGRAAGVHLILATQRPTREVIPGSITCCMTGKVALRTATAQESRNIMQISGAENFPRIGKALYHTPDLLKPEIIDII